MSANDSSSGQIRPAAHEVRGYLTWNQHGDAPYWAVRKLVEAAGGGGTFDLVVDGEPLDVTLRYPEGDSGISPRPSDSVNALKEYGLYWSTEDGRSYKTFIKPRFEPEEFRKAQFDRPFEQREKISVPPDLGDATAVQIVGGTYAPVSYYRRMIPRILLALARELGVGWNRNYLTGEPHDHASTFTTVARTVRIHREQAAKLTRDDGILSRLFHLVANTEGSKATYTADDTEVVGYYHTLDLDAEAAAQLTPSSAPGFSLKVYHPKHVRKERSRDDPLYHPRVEVAFRSSLNPSNGVAFSKVGRLVERLDEVLVNVLSWGGVPITPSTPPFVADDYWLVEARDDPVRLFDDPTPEIEREQGAMLIRALTRMTGDDVDRLSALVADGGEPRHYEDVADELDVATSTVYRFLERCGGLLESDNGVVRFISERQRQRALEILKPLYHEVDVKAEALARLLDMEPRRLRKKGSAFQAWLTQYGVDLVTGDDGSLRTLKVGAILTRLRSSPLPRVSDVLKEGLAAWVETGHDPMEFENALLRWSDSANGDFDEPNRQSKVGVAIRSAAY